MAHKIDFHDENIHFTVEIPRRAALSIMLSEQVDHTQGQTIVDVTALPPGGEIVVDADSEADDGRSIVLVTKNKERRL